jgi:hypothetical protein
MPLTRRNLLAGAAAALNPSQRPQTKRPNLLYVLPTSYAVTRMATLVDEYSRTQNNDRLASQRYNFR